MLCILVAVCESPDPVSFGLWSYVAGAKNNYNAELTLSCNVGYIISPGAVENIRCGLSVSNDAAEWKDIDNSNSAVTPQASGFGGNLCQSKCKTSVAIFSNLFWVATNNCSLINCRYLDFM